MKNDFSLKKAERLRRKVDFQRVFSQGESFKGAPFLFYVFKCPPHAPCPLKGAGDASGQIRGKGIGAGNRIGFVVSKRVGKAVMRNQVRRLLREIYRQNKGKLKEGRDLVLVARKGAGELSFWETQEVLLQLFGKAGLIKNE